MYFNGEGVPQDYSKAMEWYLKAANQGHASAQPNLGGSSMYSKAIIDRKYGGRQNWILYSLPASIYITKSGFVSKSA
ncbi:hypothetical protein EDD21DRAFT_421428 [Dissophora ornata]|nr:hypothetical protein EDD21DRAFT_421428 [Dissophora ornata]